jgi:glutaredoxin
MKYQLELYQFPSCPFCQLVIRKVDELGLNDFVTMVDIQSDIEGRNKLFNDTGRYTVPCLYINDAPMHESADICHWLDQNKDSIK